MGRNKRERKAKLEEERKRQMNRRKFLGVGATALLGLGLWRIIGRRGPISFEDARKDISLRQEYFNQLLERRGNETKYLGAILNIKYVHKQPIDNVDSVYYNGEDTVGIARVLRHEQEKKARGKVEVFGSIFDYVTSEDEVMSILDNEAYGAAVRFYGETHWPEIDKVFGYELAPIKHFQLNSPNSPLGGIGLEYGSDLYQILMFEKRKVRPEFRKRIVEGYEHKKKLLLEESKGTEFEEGARAFVRVTSMDKINQGLLRLVE